MKVIGKVKSFLGLDFARQAHDEIARDEVAAARKVAMRYSRGSVGIQSGAFQTRRDLDKALDKAGLPH
jgi:hypothetical protein